MATTHDLSGSGYSHGQHASGVQHFRTVRRMRNLHLRLAVLGCCVLADCRTGQPIKREILVGSYVYNSEDPKDRPTNHSFDRLTLRADGSYDFVQGGSTKPKTKHRGLWHFYVGGRQPTVDLDHSGFPIDVKGNEVRLLVDNDTGIWYQKVK